MNTGQIRNVSTMEIQKNFHLVTSFTKIIKLLPTFATDSESEVVIIPISIQSVSNKDIDSDTNV